MKRAMLLAVLLTPVALAAQIPQIDLGTRIKVTTATGKIIGTLMAQAEDTLEVAVSDADTAEHDAVRFRVATPDVRRIRVSQGRSGRQGAGVGAIIGGTTGAIGGAVAGFGFGNPATVASIGGMVGMIYGGIIGAIAGAEGWKRIY